MTHALVALARSINGAVGGDSMNDKVECCYCGFFGVVPIGEEICPECGCNYALAWVDDKQETTEPITVVPPELP